MESMLQCIFSSGLNAELTAKQPLAAACWEDGDGLYEYCNVQTDSTVVVRLSVASITHMYSLVWQGWN